MEVISENKGLKRLKYAACLNLEAVVLPALYLYHKFDIDCFRVTFSKHCTSSVVTTIDENTLLLSAMIPVNGRHSRLWL